MKLRQRKGGNTLIIRRVIYEGQKPTPEQKAEIEALRQMTDDDIVYDDEFPELTDEELKQFKPVNPRRKKVAS